MLFSFTKTICLFASFWIAFRTTKTVVLDRVPTAENLAQIAFETLKDVYEGFYGNTLVLKSIRIYETPNCWAEVTADSADVR